MWLAPEIQDRGLTIEMALYLHFYDVLAVGHIAILYAFNAFDYFITDIDICIGIMASAVCVCILQNNFKSNAIEQFLTRYYIGLSFQFNRHIKQNRCCL